MILVLVLANRITIDKRLYITLWTTVLCVCVVCLFVWVCVCLYVCGFIYLCVCVSMYLPACAFAYLCLRVYAVTIVSLYEIKLKQSEANHAKFQLPVKPCLNNWAKTSCSQQCEVWEKEECRKHHKWWSGNEKEKKVWV